MGSSSYPFVRGLSINVSNTFALSLLETLEKWVSERDVLYLEQVCMRLLFRVWWLDYLSQERSFAVVFLLERGEELFLPVRSGDYRSTSTSLSLSLLETLKSERVREMSSTWSKSVWGSYFESGYLVTLVEKAPIKKLKEFRVSEYTKGVPFHSLRKEVLQYNVPLLCGVLEKDFGLW